MLIKYGKTIIDTKRTVITIQMDATEREHCANLLINAPKDHDRFTFYPRNITKKQYNDHLREIDFINEPFDIPNSSTIMCSDTSKDYKWFSSTSSSSPSIEVFQE